MNKRFTKAAVPAAGLVLALGLTACSGSGGDSGDDQNATGPVPDPKEPVTISFSSWVGKQDQMVKLTKKFEKEHPNITIKFQNVPAENITQKLTTQIAGNNAPDVAYLDASAVASFASRGALVNLDNYASRSDVIDPDNYVKVFREFVTYDGSMYGLPIDGESTALYYRTDLFQEAGIEAPPKTWDELKQDAATLTDPGKKQYGYAMFAPESAYYWYPFLWQAGGDILSENGKKVLFDSKAGDKAAEFYVDMVDYASPDYLNTNSYDGRLGFFNGQIAMYPAGSWFSGTLHQEAPDIDDKWDVAPLPEGPEGCATTVAGDSLVIFEGSDKKDAAWKWIEFLSKPDNMAIWTYKSPNGTLLPTTKPLLDSPDLLETKPGLKVFADAMTCGVSNVQVNKAWPQMQAELSKELAAAMYGDVSAKEALDTAAKKAESLLQ